MKIWIVVCISMLLPTWIIAQRFGGTPPRTKWNQINTDTARIIYSAGLDSQAQRVASVIHWQAANSPGGLGEPLKKINIVLQNQTVIPNGYVGLGPYRSEFYLTPPVNNFDQGSISWIDQLAIHEYRHVQQYNHFNKGLSRLMRILFGEEGYALASNASIPDWFYEGEAVYQETRLTPQGRGRLPLFVNTYPTIWKAGKRFSWMKMRNGSMKDYVPGHYQLGYLLVNYGYEKFGDEFWKNVTHDASAFKGLFYPFQKAVKKYSNLQYRQFIQEALNHYRYAGEINANAKTETVSSEITEPEKRYLSHYLFPYQISDDSLLYLKRSYRHRPAFYIRDKSGEHRVRFRDISIDDQFSYRDGQIVYASYENDARWQWRDYSVIKILDIHSGKQRTLTTKSRYFTPDISPGGDNVIAVQIQPDGVSSLHLLESSSGEVISSFNDPEISLYSDPKFINRDSVISVVRYKDGRMGFVAIDLTNKSRTPVFQSGYTVIGNPFVDGNNIFFTASHQGSDNIFVLDMRDKSVRQVTSGFDGKYFVNVTGGGNLIWSQFTAEGYQLRTSKISGDKSEIVNLASPSKSFEAFKVAGAHQNILEQIPSRTFDTSRYAKGTRLINFHSWRPYYEDPEFSFSLYGQNVLNTLETQLYYLYNENDKTHAAGFNTVYGGWFPYIRAGLLYTFDRRQLIENKLRRWNQFDASLGLSIPLSFTRGRMYNQFTAGTDYVYRHDAITGEAKQDFESSGFSYLSHRIAFSQQVESALQHIFPRLGYAVSVQHRHAITQYKSWQFLGGASFYLPGIASTHHLVLSGSFQERDTLNILFGNRFAYSRGYNEAYASRMWRSSANYHLPLFYPDWGFANILYLRRVRANAFFDFTRIYSSNKAISRDQRSTGVEFYVDTRWWNQYDLSFGLRVARLLDNDLLTGRKETVFEFILPVSIFPR